MLWIRISFKADPVLVPDPDPGFDDQEFKKKFEAQKII